MLEVEILFVFLVFGTLSSMNARLLGSFEHNRFVDIVKCTRIDLKLCSLIWIIGIFIWDACAYRIWFVCFR